MSFPQNSCQPTGVPSLGTGCKGLDVTVFADPLLWSVVTRSLVVSGLACLFALGLGVPLGAWLGVARFWGRETLVTVVNALLAVPSVLVGLWVYLLLSRSGPLGGWGWLFSVKAMVLAQTLLVLPVVMGLTRQWVQDADHSHGEQLKSLGARPAARAVLLAWDERFALLTVALAAFGRAISEVGAVMMVGGNIDGFTRVMTTSIALETSKGDLPVALALGGVLLAVVLVLNLLASWLRRWRERVEGQGALIAPGGLGTANVLADGSARTPFNDERAH